jgi:hypothetical protein
MLFPINQVQPGKDNIPAVFTIDMPDGKDNIFASTRKFYNDDTRLISINKYVDSNLELGILLGMKLFNNFWCINSSTDEQRFWGIIELVIKDIIEYYSGDKPGWKDKKEGA